jgi:dTDP-4-dehydrorhamnose reductase
VKLLVVGAAGLLGSEFIRSASAGGHEVRGTTRADLDVTNASNVDDVLESVRPDAVAFCAGVTHVDRAEADPDAAWAVNRDGALNVARACRGVGARMVYFSTDYVFDGHAREPYLPDEPTSPINAYGRSKVDGEVAVSESGADYFIARVSWLFGAGRLCFVTSMLEKARAGEALKIVEDQRTRPTYTRNVVDVTLSLLGARAEGVWHIADGGPVPSRYEIMREALSAMELDVPVHGIRAADLWTDVPRPKYTALDLKKTEQGVGRPMEDWRESLGRFLREEVA